jgi:hypothetical protein
MPSDPVLRREVAPRGKRLWVSVLSGLFCVVLASLVGATIAVAARSHAVLTFSLPPLRFDRPPVSRCSKLELRATLSRAVVDNWLTTPGTLLRAHRIVPLIRNGFKTYAIRPGSPLDLIGLKNGDVVRRIWGIEVAAPDAGREIHVDLIRRGCPVSLTIASM